MRTSWSAFCSTLPVEREVTEVRQPCANKNEHRARTHVDAFHSLVAKLEDALYASGHFLVFPLFILYNGNEKR
jgi:hypothetical protein